MLAIIEPPPKQGDPVPPLWKRVAWFAGLAIVGAGSTAAIAYVMRMLLR
jgi:hypothetical protein